MTAVAGRTTASLPTVGGRSLLNRGHPPARGDLPMKREQEERSPPAKVVGLDRRGPAHGRGSTHRSAFPSGRMLGNRHCLRKSTRCTRPDPDAAAPSNYPPRPRSVRMADVAWKRRRSWGLYVGLGVRARAIAGLVFVAVAAWATGGAAADEKVRLQLKWVPQAQFAGYYAAQAKGFYAAERLDVTLVPGGPEIAASKVVADRGAEVGIDWLPAMLAARDQGAPLVNIAQIFAHSGLRQVAFKSSGIK